MLWHWIKTKVIFLKSVKYEWKYIKKSNFKVYNILNTSDKGTRSVYVISKRSQERIIDTWVIYLAIYATHTANRDSPLYINTKHADYKSRLDFLIKNREKSHTRGFTPHMTKRTERAHTGHIYVQIFTTYPWSNVQDVCIMRLVYFFPHNQMNKYMLPGYIF